MKISVVTICLNGEEHLAEALQSVVDQDFGHLECLVIDGGSRDGSVAIIRDFAVKCPALRWWSEPDNGISDAMNLGLERATGEWVAFLHADDSYIGPSVLSEVARIIKAHPKACWLTAGIREVDAKGQLVRNLAVRRYSRSRLLRNNILYHPATFVRRQTLMGLGGFDTSLQYAMDYDLWLRLANIAPPVVIDKILTNFRVHPGSRSSAQRLMALDEEYQVRTRYLEGPYEILLHRVYQKLRRALEKPAMY